MADPIEVQRASFESLFIEMISGGEVVASGTGFLYALDGNDYLITARHCLTGKRPSGEFISASIRWQPSTVRIHFRRMDGAVAQYDFALATDEFEPTWMGHPLHGARVDLAALPLPDLPDEIRGRWTRQPDHPLVVTDDVSIVGYPFGLRAGAYLPIWARGTIATEPGVPYEGLPVFLVDSRTRTGQSGSPVVQFFPPFSPMRNPDPEDTNLAWGSRTGPVTRLLGVYTGRVNSESDLGFVWKMSVVDAICSQSRSA